jgi:hypothetical protein
MTKWTEVDAYSGQPIDEKAPTNNAGSGKVAMPPDAMMKKKKKTFLDARTKAYKEHQKKLEASRQRREERKKNAAKMNEGQISEMKKVEITLNNPNDAKKIQKDVIDLTNKKRKVNITMKQMGKKLIIDGGDYDINREVADIRNFIGFKSAKVVEDIQPMTFSQKIKEQVTAFGRESFLAENNMDVIKSIVKSKGAKDLKMKDGKLKMDAFTASAIAQVYDKVNPTNKKKMEDLANGKKSDLMKLQKLAMKFVK